MTFSNSSLPESRKIIEEWNTPRHKLGNLSEMLIHYIKVIDKLPSIKPCFYDPSTMQELEEHLQEDGRAS